MLDEVQIAIDGAAIAPDTELRLQPCLKWLAEALGNCAPVDALMVASATPRGALVFAAEAWPIVNYDEPVDDAKVALAVHQASEGGTRGDIVLRGLTRLLGRSGLAAAAKDAACIISQGGFPLVVLLTEHTGTHVTVVSTVTRWEERRVLH
jgi:hypothetical protein